MREASRRKKNQQAPTAIIVAGMHRSGTSAMAGALAAVGASLPLHILGASKGNDLGHWEPALLVGLNERILADLGSSWTDWRPVAVSQDEDFINPIAELIDAEFGKSPLIVLKDPRICRIIPLYEKAFARMDIAPVYVLPFRHPEEVAMSLRQRDGITLPYAGLLWARHVLDAELETRGKRRVFTSFDALLKDPVETVSKIARVLDLNWPSPPAKADSKVQASMHPEYRHFSAQLADAPQSPLQRWLHLALDALRALEVDPHDAAAMQALDRVRARLDGPDWSLIASAEFCYEDKKRRHDALPAPVRLAKSAFRRMRGWAGARLRAHRR